MDKTSVNGVIYWLPSDVQEVISLVNEAHQNNEIICLRGSAHSFPLIGDLEQGSKNDRKYKYVMLSKMNKVSIDTTAQVVTAQAGCHLGHDPWDPTGISTVENSLLYQLNEKGYGISDLGGIIHQTIGGFMSTGSSGGSTEYSFDEPLLSIDIVHFGASGAEVITYVKPDHNNPDDDFYGVAISLGIMGVIVSIRMKCEPAFYIKGSETITKAVDCEIDLFGAGNSNKPDPATYFNQTQFSRLMWWPQKDVEKMVVWKAQKTSKQEAIAYAAQAYDKRKVFPHPELKPYREVPYIFGSPTLATLGADLLYTSIGQWPKWLLDILGDTKEYRSIKLLVESMFYPKILPMILDVFEPVDKPETGPQEFADVGWKGLPMDNQMSDKLFPVKFTELWIPLHKAAKVMKILHDFYSEGSENTGAFSCEIYAAKANNCWLSPAYGTNVIRVDVFWFGNDLGEPTSFYEKFWELLAPLGFRPHWGKYLPDGKGPQGTSYLRPLYPQWDKWLNLRERVDPDQVFLNDYWREHLDIPQKK